MNFVPCLTWVPRGLAKTVPDKLQLSAEEMKELMIEEKQIHVGHPGEEEEEEVTGDKELEDEYFLGSYDDEDGDSTLKLSDLVVHPDNKDDEYILVEKDEDDIEEEENFTLKKNDNLLVVGHIEDEFSEIQVYVYNEEEDSLYVHHDIVLPAYPVAIEYLDFHPSDSDAGNYIAVGDMTPTIKIWDLDVVDVLQPECTLGGTSKKKKKKKSAQDKPNGHSDAVLALSWNKPIRNVLASGSADTTIALWDLEAQCPIHVMQSHVNKVQTVQWHPTESDLLISGSCDGFAKMFDRRVNPCEVGSWKIDGEVEKATWNVFEPHHFLCSSDEGFIYHMDTRANCIRDSFRAHEDAVTGLDMSLGRPHTLLTAGMDSVVKLWNIQNEAELIETRVLKVGSIYAAQLAPDLKFTAAIGGNNASHHLQVVTKFEQTEADPGCSSSTVRQPKRKKIKH